MQRSPSLCRQHESAKRIMLSVTSLHDDKRFSTQAVEISRRLLVDALFRKTQLLLATSKESTIACMVTDDVQHLFARGHFFRTYDFHAHPCSSVHTTRSPGLRLEFSLHSKSTQIMAMLYIQAEYTRKTHATTGHRLPSSADLT
jgi:hypothetical protein